MRSSARCRTTKRRAKSESPKSKIEMRNQRQLLDLRPSTFDLRLLRPLPQLGTVHQALQLRRPKPPIRLCFPSQLLLLASIPRTYPRQPPRREKHFSDLLTRLTTVAMNP